MAIHFPLVPATYRNIPKTGTTSFKWWARDNIPNCEILEDPNRIYNMSHLSLDEVRTKWPNYGTTFTFVRNPYDRMVSIFHHVGQDAENRLKQRPLGGTTEKYGVRQEELDSIPIEQDIRIIGIYRKGFDHWVQSNDTATFNSSLTALLNQKETQMHWLNHIVPDIVIKIEEVASKFYLLQDLLQCKVSFPHINKSQHDDYRQYYTPATQKIVAELFKEDFETFGYTVNL